MHRCRRERPSSRLAVRAAGRHSLPAPCTPRLAPLPLPALARAAGLRDVGAPWQEQDSAWQAGVAAWSSANVASAAAAAGGASSWVLRRRLRLPKVVVGVLVRWSVARSSAEKARSRAFCVSRRPRVLWSALPLLGSYLQASCGSEQRGRAVRDPTCPAPAALCRPLCARGPAFNPALTLILPQPVQCYRWVASCK